MFEKREGILKRRGGMWWMGRWEMLTEFPLVFIVFLRGPRAHHIHGRPSPVAWHQSEYRPKKTGPFGNRNIRKRASLYECTMSMLICCYRSISTETNRVMTIFSLWDRPLLVLTTWTSGTLKECELSRKEHKGGQRTDIESSKIRTSFSHTQQRRWWVTQQGRSGASFMPEPLNIG